MFYYMCRTIYLLRHIIQHIERHDVYLVRLTLVLFKTDFDLFHLKNVPKKLFTISKPTRPSIVVCVLCLTYLIIQLFYSPHLTFFPAEYIVRH